MKDTSNTALNEIRLRLLREEITKDKYDELISRVSPVPTWLPLPLQEWLPLIGALAFGGVVGWTAHHILVSAEADIKLLASIVGVIGGGAVTALFPAKGMLFGTYCIGLALAFFIHSAMI